MTIAELEQGLRNLIASQPMVLSGNLGDVVRGVLGVTEAYRNFIYRVQSYPVQDVFKFSLMSETQKVESDIAGLATAMLQERGINMMLYIPQQPASPYNASYPQGAFGMGQMSYNPMQNAGAMQYNQMPPNMQQMPNMPRNEAYSRQVYSNNSISAKPKMPVPEYSAYQPTGKPSFAEPENEEIVNSKKERTTKPEIVINEKPAKEKSADALKKSSPADALVGETEPNETSAPTEKAAGRDYLLELLKK